MGEPKGLKGRVALIVGGGSRVGRHLALALAARGVSVVVTGPVERTLGLTVGEIVYGAGKARHLPGDVRSASVLAAGVARAREVFGRLDVLLAVIGTEEDAPSSDGGRAVLRAAVEAARGADSQRANGAPPLWLEVVIDASDPAAASVTTPLRDEARAMVARLREEVPDLRVHAHAVEADLDEDAAMMKTEGALLRALADD